jgi:hypothetical protein
MRRLVVRELIAHPERVALNLRTENRSGFVPHVDLELKFLVLTVHHCICQSHSKVRAADSCTSAKARYVYSL